MYKPHLDGHTQYGLEGHGYGEGLTSLSGIPVEEKSPRLRPVCRRDPILIPSSTPILIPLFPKNFRELVLSYIEVLYAPHGSKHVIEVGFADG